MFFNILLLDIILGLLDTGFIAFINIIHCKKIYVLSNTNKYIIYIIKARKKSTLYVYIKKAIRPVVVAHAGRIC